MTMIKLLFILQFSYIFALGQSSLERDIVSVIKITWRNQRLPIELISVADSSVEYSTGKEYIAIQGTTNNRLLTTYDQSTDKLRIHIWHGEEIFLWNTHYWMYPDLIQRTDKTLLINYKTVAGSIRIGEKRKNCYKGTIKAVFENGRWDVTKSNYKKTACETGATKLNE